MNNVEDFMLSLSKEVVVCTINRLTHSRQKLKFERSLGRFDSVHRTITKSPMSFVAMVVLPAACC
ncbi:hypothetical protein OE88DRAFT_145345 [Heliocybe sulcata]|uniref:Uncharacterized protein n=1 Tax=Heliocybe sulcata TaxID=5364 RepID=A0A5C3NHX1_9AGAM|nr:hypothetical protein OE88DRAFT_145345 [Heliocybe sulcata]